MLAPDADAVMANVTALLAAVGAANRAALALVAAPRSLGDEQRTRMLVQAAPWLNEAGPAIASAVPRSLFRFGSSFRTATTPSEIRGARQEAERGSLDYFVRIIRRQTQQASSAREQVEHLLTLLGKFDGQFLESKPHRQIAAGLARLHDLWRDIESRSQVLGERLKNPDTNLEDIPGLSEFEISRARQAWGALARFANDIQTRRQGRHA